MRWLNSKTHYGQLPRLLHWSSVALLITIVLNAAELDGLSASAARMALENEHFSYGVALFLVMLVRLTLRFRSLNPVESYRIHSLQRIAAFGLHRSIYVVILGLGVTGLINGLAAAESLRLFDGPTIPNPLSDNEYARTAIRSLHVFLSYLVYPLFACHIGAAIVHQLIGVRDEEPTD